MTFFTADTHFGHAGILNITDRQQRKDTFSSIEEHDGHILDQINTRVQRNDRLIICGDFCFKNPQKYRMRIRCREVWLIFGNHDKRSWANCFSQAYDVKMIKDGDFRVWASHYAHAYWPSSHHGVSHVYGHTHALREGTLDELFPHRRSMDVGVDNVFRLTGEYRPLSIGDVRGYTQCEAGHDQVEFYRKVRGECEN